MSCKSTIKSIIAIILPLAPTPLESWIYKQNFKKTMFFYTKNTFSQKLKCGRFREKLLYFIIKRNTNKK